MTRIKPRPVTFTLLLALAACGQAEPTDTLGGASTPTRDGTGGGNGSVATGGAGGRGGGGGGAAGAAGLAGGGSAGAGAGTGGTTTAVPACDPGCASYGPPVALGPISSRVHELSGLAASRRHPGLLYTHNDSGDSARFFAMNESATVTAELDLPGATNVDWEDIAVGPCPAGSCVYLSDSGDGTSSRGEYTIYRVTEPETLPTDGSARSVAYDRFPFVYPDGSHNAEALLVHPETGQMFIIIKEANNPALYEVPTPLVPDQRMTLRKVTTMAFTAADGVVTGATFHPCGDRMLVRTSETLYELARATGQSLTGMFNAPPFRVPVAVEPQGEAVTYSLDGRRYFTSSETGATPPPLSVVGCAP
jgi:hypothetical protein